MTSGKYFLKFLKQNRKQKIWMWALSCLVFLLFLLSFFMQNILVYTNEEFFGIRNVQMMVLTVALAFICAFQGYGYLLHTKTAEFYSGLPVKRMHLFWGNYINGLLVYLLPMLIAQSVCFLMVLGAGRGNGMQLLLYFLWGLAIHTIMYLCFYHLAITAILLSGNIPMAVGMSVVLLCYVPMVLNEVILPLCRQFFQTFYKSNFITFLQEYFIPWRLYARLNGLFERNPLQKYEYIPDWKGILILLGICVCLLCFAVWLQKYRTTEMTGRVMAFRKGETILHVLVDIPVALFIGNLMLSCVERRYQMVAGVMGCLLGGIICYGILNIVFRMRFRKVYEKKKWLIAELAGAVLILAVFWIEKEPFDRYIPKQQEITAIGISIAGLDEPELHEYQETRLEHVKMTDMEMEKTYDWLQEELLGREGAGMLSDVTVAYHLKNGNTVYRNYPIDEVAQLEAFNSVYSTEAYKSKIYEVFSYKNYEKIEVLWKNGIESMTLKLDGSEVKSLLETYCGELSRQDIKSLEQESVNGILFISDEEFGKETVAYLYPGFQKTLALLSEYGVPSEKKISEYEIEEIEVEEYSYQPGNRRENGYRDVVGGMVRRRETYTRKEEIEKIADKLVYRNYAIQPILNPVDKTKKVTVKFSNGTKGTVHEVEYYMK